MSILPIAAPDFVFSATFSALALSVSVEFISSSDEGGLERACPLGGLILVNN